MPLVALTNLCSGGEQQRISEERQSRFEQTDKSLRAIGAISLSRFADASSSEIDGLFDLPDEPVGARKYYGALKPLRTLADLDVGSSSLRTASASIPAVGTEGSAGTGMQYVAQLHQACIATFGNADGLVFEFSEETGKPDSESSSFENELQWLHSLRLCELARSCSIS